MKIHFQVNRFLLVSLFALFGCRQDSQIPLNDDLRLVPGVGVVGYCEVDMRVKEVKRNCLDVRLISGPDCNKKYMYEIPDWGIWFTARRGKPIGGLTIEVVSSTKSIHPFRGSVDGGVSFSSGAVGRESVIKVFGPPVLFGTNSFAVFPDPTDAVSICFPELSLERLYYPDRGIGFMLKTNIIETIYIAPPR